VVKSITRAIAGAGSVAVDWRARTVRPEVRLVARTILMLDTPAHDLRTLAETFAIAAGNNVDIQVMAAAAELLDRLRSGLPYDLVVLDWVLGDGKTKGMTVLREVRTEDAVVPIIAVAEQGDVKSVARAIELGATDFLVRGGRLKERVSTLLAKVRNLLEVIEQNRILGEQNMLLREADRARYRMIGESPELTRVIAQIERVAGIPRPVLITGERGTGKELVARAIHEAAGRAGRPFVAVNCAAFTDTLLENELFGHERGAFTGADHHAHGKFAQAAGGTLFLDEIGNMSLPFQRKILRVVEYGVFTRVGGREEIHTDARIIAATNANLMSRMERGRFLRDLYDRLAFEVIDVPPLRDRKGDVDILARHFLREFMREIPSLGQKRLATSALEALRRYPFPGNIRELKNIMERAAYRDATNEITPEDIDLPARPEASADAPGRNFDEKVENFKRSLILETLKGANGNRAEAARRLGISYHQYRYYYQKYAGR